jgi:hypothetical protein
MGAGHDHHHHELEPVEGSWRDEADDRPLSVARRRFLTGMGVAAAATAVGTGHAAAEPSKYR